MEQATGRTTTGPFFLYQTNYHCTITTSMAYKKISPWSIWLWYEYVFICFENKDMIKYRQQSVFFLFFFFLVLQIAACDPFELIIYDTPMRWVKPRMLQRAIMSITQINMNPNVKELRAHQRNCKVHNDGGLKTWPLYTRNMCITECRMKVIQDKCNCRPHFARPIGW